MLASSFRIVDDRLEPADGDQLTALLTRVYVDGGFTPADLAPTVFAADAVRARGHLWLARDGADDLAGMVVVVPPDSPARVWAGPDEAEMHLLAVRPEARGTGTGAALVTAALAHARAWSFRRMILWTQPSMDAAQRLYTRAGFSRTPERDFERRGIGFWMYTVDLGR